ncbi:MAG: SLC13 family permease [Chloroflexota bacterium]|nr:SLC13 family permease [Chloroflexota bacterium]
MTLDMWIALGILVSAIVLFVTEWIRVDIVALSVVVALMLSGLLTTDEALAGFSNPAVLSIAALFVVGGAVLNTGLADVIGRRILTVAGESEARLVMVIMVTVALLSAVISSTGTVAVLLPAIVSVAQRSKISPSRLLMPLSFGALLGGSTTLIGTPPNLIVSDLLVHAGLEEFGFFDYTPIGLALLMVGIPFMLLVGRRLLPDRKPQPVLQRVDTPQELIAHYRLPDNLFRLRVRRESELVGQTVVESALGRRFDLAVIEILRPSPSGPLRSLIGRSNGAQSVQPEATTVLQAHDLLIVQGDASDIGAAAAFWNLGVQPVSPDDEDALITDEIGLAEVLLRPRSSLVGETIVEADFGRRFHLTVLGINRPGVDALLDLKTTPFRFGDILLVQGAWKHILALREHPKDFVVMGQPERMISAPQRAKAGLTLLVMAGMLILLVTNVLPVATASLLAALTVVLTGCLTMDEAYGSIDWRSVVLVAGMLPLSLAMEKVALVDLAARGLINILGSLGPLAVLAGLFLLTSVFTQVLSNTATTVLIAPVALAAAQALEVRPYAFVMAVAIAASMGMASPVASPVNTLVMGAGHYRFADYLKVGGPLILLLFAVSTAVLPLLWPF